MFHGLCEGDGEAESARAGGTAEAAPGRIVAVAGVDGVGSMGVTGGGTPVIRAMTRAR